MEPFCGMYFSKIKNLYLSTYVNSTEFLILQSKLLHLRPEIIIIKIWVSYLSSNVGHSSFLQGWSWVFKKYFCKNLELSIAVQNPQNCLFLLDKLSTFQHFPLTGFTVSLLGSVEVDVFWRQSINLCL